ncbi:MAG TPA: hypothetical protein VFD55_01740 [Candidatus Angelobacter sp.]|nr:hypothetical protein [Candidatus Angelobacter sp.]
MFNNLTKKQKIIYIAVAIVIVAAITVGAIFAFKSINSNSNSNKVTPTAETATSLKDQGVAAEKTNSTDEAKRLFQEAKQQYEAIGDTNGVVDMNAKLYLIEHQYTPSP